MYLLHCTHKKSPAKRQGFFDLFNRRLPDNELLDTENIVAGKLDEIDTFRLCA